MRGLARVPRAGSFPSVRAGSFPSDDAAFRFEVSLNVGIFVLWFDKKYKSKSIRECKQRAVGGRVGWGSNSALVDDRFPRHGGNCSLRKRSGASRRSLQNTHTESDSNSHSAFV